MKLKFFIAGLAIVAGLASAVSCQDLTKDLTDLKSKVASLESTVQALQSKIDAGAVITSVTPSNSGIIITLSNGNKYEITNGVNGKDGTNGKDGKDGKDGADGTPGSVVTIGEDGNWYIDGVDTGLAAQGEDGEDGTPGAFFVPDPETGCFDMFVWDPEKEEYVSTPTEIPFVAEGTLTAVYNPLTGVVTLYGIEGYEGGYEIGGSHADSVTSVELIDSYLGNIAEVTEQENVFGPNGELVFTEDLQTMRETAVVVKVIPADATISKSDVTLINSKGETYDKFEIVSVEPYDGVITKATTDFALWKVVISLSEYDEEEFEKACGKNIPGQRTAFAVKIGEAVTAYDVAFFHSVYTADDARLIASEPILVYEGDIAYNIFGLKNRNNQPDYLWANSTKKVPTPAVEPVASGAGKNIGAIDNRTAFGPLKANVGKPIYITTDPDQYKGIYAEVDYAQCLPADPSEKAAWESYTITGVDELSTEGVLAITVSSPAADGDEIAFRVYAVNWDGTLADPDGISFVAIFGEDASTEWDTVDAVLTPVKNGDFGVTAAVAPIVTSKLANAASWMFAMDDPINDPGFTVSALLDKDKKPVAAGDWSKVKYVSVTPTGIDYQDYVDEKPYFGTITIYDSNDFLLATCPVSFTKSLEGLKVPAGFSFKEGMLDANKNYTVYAEAGVNRTTVSAPGAAIATVVDFIKWAENNYNVSVKAKDIPSAAHYLWRKYNAESIALNLNTLYKFAATADKTNFLTAVEGDVEVVGNTATDWSGAYVTLSVLANGAKVYGLEQKYIAGDAAAAFSNTVFDNKAHKAVIAYNYGFISTTEDEDGLPVPATEPTMIKVDEFTLTCKTPVATNEWSWNWNVWDAATLLGEGSMAANPTHNARLVYNKNANAYAVAPYVVNVYAEAGNWTKTGTATWAADPFAIDYTPNLYLEDPNFLGFVYDNVAATHCNIAGKSDKAAFTGDLKALEAAGFIYIRDDADAVAKPTWGETKNFVTATLGSGDYYTVNYATAGTAEFNLTKVATAAEPSVVLPQTFTINAYDIYANPIKIQLPTNIVPKP